MLFSCLRPNVAAEKDRKRRDIAVNQVERRLRRQPEARSCCPERVQREVDPDHGPPVVRIGIAPHDKDGVVPLADHPLGRGAAEHAFRPAAVDAEHDQLR
jgi:hypothetical protein